MSPATQRWAMLVSLLIFTASGCSYFQSTVADDDADLEMDNLEQVKSEDTEHPVVPRDPVVQEGELELKLKVGDRFPLKKLVERRMTQTDSTGQHVNLSRTEMMLSLNVEEIQSDGRKLMSVHYHRVKYDQEIRGKHVGYTSDNPGEPVPVEALLYAGLADNGFSFWIGPNNKVIEIVGFNDFLKRCLKKVPPNHAATVRKQLEATKSEEGIANFIDDSIGLLPFSNDPSHPAVAVKEGSTWKLEPRQTDAPIPMLVTTQCMVEELTVGSAKILLTGQISGPPTPVTMRSPEGDIKIFVKGGNCTGTCRVDRSTGLPTQSRIVRYLELAMELPDGQKIQQNKDTISTITSFLNQMPSSPANSEQRVQQTTFRNAAGTESHRRVEHAGGARQN